MDLLTIFCFVAGLFYFIQNSLKTAFPVLRRGALSRSLGWQGANFVGAASLRHFGFAPDDILSSQGGGGTANPTKRGFPPPLCLPLGGGVRAAALWQTLSRPCEPFRFHPKNPFLTPLPPFPRFGSWRLRVCFFSVGFILLFGVRLCVF